MKDINLQTQGAKQISNRVNPMATTKTLKTSGEKLKNQMEITELKNTITKISLLDGLDSQVEITEDRIGERKERLIEYTQLEYQKGFRKETRRFGTTEKK